MLNVKDWNKLPFRSQFNIRETFEYYVHCDTNVCSSFMNNHFYFPASPLHNSSMIPQITTSILKPTPAIQHSCTVPNGSAKNS